ncbi:efflux transporter outer membrane subunit [Variovorax dokdonensis]|uniref:Efflux transporter outer membrane subunit n=1 Tax=Variovorax dokdonensis TaxID=344883 RepID=A0ABT7N565_9BURK|nr:efflux transporter outer membrane subunit [Variovorax dokdonensis]MDM0043068.1 efflux transporter outer membrane subunit [Variovorax dokdonensis]
MPRTDLHGPATRAPLPVLAATCAALLLVSACTLGPDYRRPELVVPEQFRAAPAESTSTSATATDTAWWQQFGDPQLDALVDEALANNLDVVAAAARVDQFYGVLGTTRAALFPQVGADLTGSRQRASRETVTGAPLTNPYDSVQAALLASWELDLFGRTRRLTEAATAEARASEAFRRGTVLSLVAAVTTGYVLLRDLDKQVEVARDTVKLREDSLKLFERRFKGGVVSDLEVSQARSEYATALRTLPQLEYSAAQQENALSVLVGRNPGPVSRGRAIDQLALPVVPAGLPSELIERRPDLVAAEQALVAANARIGAAKAAYFPSISLTGAFGGASRSLSDLSKGSARIWSYGLDISVPIFTAGAIAGQVQSAEAAQRESLARYRKAVQSGFQETENALVGVSKSRQARDAAEQQTVALINYARLARRRYDGGYTSYLEVLDAERSLFNAQLQLSQSQAEVLLQSAALYKAMGGGWLDLADQKTLQPSVATREVCGPAYGNVCR